MGTPGEVNLPENSKNAILSNRLEDILQCSGGLGQRVVVTSATFPYHVEWTNTEWSKACGWQSDEILGTSHTMTNSHFATLALQRSTKTPITVISGLESKIQRSVSSVCTFDGESAIDSTILY